MASALVTSTDVPELFQCPVCFNLPEKEVYQCWDGHVLCKKCYSQLTECPQCRSPFDPARPIRNRFLEGMLNTFQVDCPFKSVGCGKKIPKHKIKEHKRSCCYDFNKFGEFVLLCQLIGFTQCKFQANNGNAEELVQHLISTHGCNLTTGKKFKIEIRNLADPPMFADNQTQFWKPVVCKVQEKFCFILVLPFIEKTGSLSFLTLVLPYSTKKKQQKSNHVRLNYFLFKEDVDDEDLRILQTPSILTTLNKVGKVFTSEDPEEKMENIQINWLRSKLNIERGADIDKLFILCKIILNCSDRFAEKEKNVEKFTCEKHVSNLRPSPNTNGLVRWNLLKRSSTAEDLFKECRRNGDSQNRELIQQFIDKIFSADFNREDKEWLGMGALFLAAQFGTVKSLQNLIRRGLKVNITNEKGETPLHWAIYEKDKKIQLKKIRIFVDQEGASVRLLTNQNQNLLHYATRHGSPEVVEYLIKKGLDVREKDVNGTTPMHKAVLNENEDVAVEITKLLLNAKKYEQFHLDCDNQERSPLDLADFNCKLKLCELFEEWERRLPRF